MARAPRQLLLPTPPTWGGRRAGAGRKRAPDRRPGVPHRARPKHVAAHPVHVTLRAVDALRCLRAGRVFSNVRRALAASSRADFSHHRVQRAERPRTFDRRSHRRAHTLQWGPRAGDPTRSGGEPRSRSSRTGLGRAVSRPRAHDAARRPPCPRLRPNELPEASSRCDRDRSVLVSRMVHRLAHVRRSGRWATARRGRADLARADRMAATRTHRPRRKTKE